MRRRGDMKSLIAILLGCLAIIFSNSALAGCYENGEFTSCGACQCGSSYVTECQCTDPNVGRKHCMSVAEYCEVFGNVGAR